MLQYTKKSIFTLDILRLLETRKHHDYLDILPTGESGTSVENAVLPS